MCDREYLVNVHMNDDENWQCYRLRLYPTYTRALISTSLLVLIQADHKPDIPR